MKGKTKSGFEYKISKERLDNYELLEAIVELETNPLTLSKVVIMLLGKEQTEKLKDHLRTKDGIVPAEKMSEEITEIFQSHSNTKNS
ncbi:hypothetical protein F6X86_13565 [Enterococcus durans]|uniref:Phage protein n=1 Tax=Enterococcus durans TaxID=53345 RepID=A0A5N0YMN8_9ENTE|nr:MULTISPECIES: hypothetical protein [Enterococcus]KAA9176724.1 hypothetical protein F6X86_13565 [Enterococcus durans]KAA9182448.1 hypothetical protein F6X85_13565 [Enterococcus durans]KAA9187917.1 hypothetical protein F6X90_03340 [Enterococcus durans]KAA9187951.1 hypothetical protein F6Y12_13685 [Enterococcus durans]KAA9190233.1 hypothetical protein F6X88_13470 [Enterococcus durans]